MAELRKEDVLTTFDVPGPTYESTFNLPAGRTWIMIENQTDQTVEFRLEVFAP